MYAPSSSTDSISESDIKLLCAIVRGEPEAVKQAIKAGANVNVHVPLKKTLWRFCLQFSR